MIVPVILADPHPVARAALTALLREDGGLEVIPVAELAEASGRPVPCAGPDRLAPAAGNRTRGDATARAAPRAHPDDRRRLEDDPAFAVDARRAGAAAYVLKDRADRDLRPAIDALLEEPALTTTWQLSA
jgi:DNA-binding NarL/FixJ family response regulator